jgi:hypothetical protein
MVLTGSTSTSENMKGFTSVTTGLTQAEEQHKQKHNTF